jgi:hypothetical protein
MTYPEFWQRYLRAHSDPRTRALHYAGSTLAFAVLAAAALTRDWRWLLAAPVIGYAFAWTAHFAVEGNRPETFGHPLWSLASDFRMLALFACGRLGPELQQAGVAAGRKRDGAADRVRRSERRGPRRL